MNNEAVFRHVDLSSVQSTQKKKKQTKHTFNLLTLSHEKQTSVLVYLSVSSYSVFDSSKQHDREDYAERKPENGSSRHESQPCFSINSSAKTV